ncbi:MAG: aldose 1-epimerase family protein [Bacteroidota bacterium]
MTLENDYLKLEIVSLGAELKSVFKKGIQKEVLYQGDSPFWNRSSPVLFPIVGKLKDNFYHLEDREYVLGQHGFARDFDFEQLEKKSNLVRFSLKYSEVSLEKYPFKFELKISYRLILNRVEVNYEVCNIDSKTLPFSLGAHPGFTCPVFENERFEDYYLEFEHQENLERHLLNTSSGLFNGEKELVLIDSNHLDLDYSYFEKDALVFKNMKSMWIKLRSKKSDYCLKFSFENYPSFGIWTKAQAPFICLEPWFGLADSENSSGVFTEKEGMIFLAPSEKFECAFSFEV